MGIKDFECKEKHSHPTHFKTINFAKFSKALFPKNLTQQQNLLKDTYLAQNLIPLFPQENPRLYQELQSLCEKMNLSNPVLLMVEKSYKNNAFCHFSLNQKGPGNEQIYAIYFTENCIRSHTADELIALLGHELGHAKDQTTKKRIKRNKILYLIKNSIRLTSFVYFFAMFLKKMVLTAA